MNMSVLKASCLAIFLLAAIGPLMALPPDITVTLQYAAAVLLGLHSLELLFAFKILRRHPGPLFDSIALTLLFGLLHWFPLRKR